MRAGVTSGGQPLPALLERSEMAKEVYLNQVEIRRLAYRLWEERNRPFGSPETDWFRAEEILAYKAAHPVPRSLSAGIDDVATEKGLTAGWGYFVLPGQAVSSFVSDASKLVPAGRNEFHANEMAVSETGAYQDFLGLIRNYIEAHPYAFACVLGADVNWGGLFSQSAERITESVLRSLGVADAGTHAKVAKVNKPIWALLRLLRFNGANVSLDLNIDSDSFIAGFGSTALGVNTAVGPATVSGSAVLAKFSNAYANRLFPDAPRTAADGSLVAILPSEQSYLVQAADVVGNFAFAHAMYVLGLQTKGRERKSRIFEAVFGPQPAILISRFTQLAGNEIEVTVAGNLKFLASDHFYGD